VLPEIVIFMTRTYLLDLVRYGQGVSREGCWQYHSSRELWISLFLRFCVEQDCFSQKFRLIERKSKKSSSISEFKGVNRTLSRPIEVALAPDIHTISLSFVIVKIELEKERLTALFDLD
jgi:hypothetical protein